MSIGKACYEKAVCIDFHDEEHSILHLFESSKESREFYEKVNISKDRFVTARFKMLFCKHKDERAVDVGSKFHHYIHCPNCNRAIFVDDESLEERETRINQVLLRAAEEDLERMKEAVIEKEKEVESLKNRL